MILSPIPSPSPPLCPCCRSDYVITRDSCRKTGCVFRTKVTGRFGIVTGDFGNVTDHFGNVTERPGRQDWRCA